MEAFFGSHALRRGALTRRSLASGFVAIYRDVYIPRDLEMTAQIRAQAAWLATGATLCGLSASAVFGTKWLDPRLPAEIVRSNRRSPAGIAVRSWEFDPDEVCVIDGIAVTTPARTAFDIGRSRPASQAIPMMDALLNATRIPVSRRFSGRCSASGRTRRRAVAVGARIGRRWKVAVEYDGVQHWTDGSGRGTSTGSRCLKLPGGWLSE
ncbi:hypothetical protein ABIA30_001992 [Mycobacterium sp. MAA66]